MVEKTADILSTSIGSECIFYDKYYQAQLARPNLDTLLQDIYRNRSRLIVVYLCGEYNQREWCNIEWKAVREILMDKNLHSKIMYIKADDGEVDGVFKNDGYIDVKEYTPEDIAGLIVQRLQSIMV